MYQYQPSAVNVAGTHNMSLVWEDTQYLLISSTPTITPTRVLLLSAQDNNLFKDLRESYRLVWF